MVHFSRLVAVTILLTAGRLGAAVVCAQCHPAETRNYQLTAMGKSFGEPEHVAAGDVEERQSGAHIHTEWRAGKLLQRLSEEGLTAEYALRYQIGAGRVGHSYAVFAGGSLLEAPASFYKRFGWDVSPGCGGSELLDVNRVLTERCLFCHSNPPEIYRQTRFAMNDLQALSCERCHGDTTAHVTQPSSNNIVNPGKLAGRVRDSVCEQCHLEGVARVLNPGKTMTSFRPGKTLEDAMVTYVASGGGLQVRAVSQEEQLAESRCARESGGKLWCGTCHNPHSASKDRVVEIRSVCRSCHPVLSGATHERVTECVSCHMPRRAPRDVAHAALTDHRIRERPESVAPTAGTYDEIRAWQEPPAELRDRDLALAYLQSAADGARSELLRDKGKAILDRLPDPMKSGDPEIAAASGSIALEDAHPSEAVTFFERAVELAPESAEYAMKLGIAQQANGNLDGAQHELARAIELDPALQRAYVVLSAVMSKQGHKEQSASVLDSYLQRNPQSILIRLMRQTLESQKK